MRAGLLRQLSDIYIYTGRTDRAIEAGMASAALWRDLGDVAKQVEAYLHVSFCWHWQERESEAVEYIQRALQCIEQRPEETALLAKAYAQWGMAATVMGDAPLAREKLAQADTLHEQIGGNDPFITVVSLWSRSWCALQAESPRQMLDYALQGAEACIRLQKPEWEPMMSYSAAWAYMLLGQLKEGQQKADEALKKAQRHGVVGAQGWAHLIKAFVAIQAGSWEEAATNADKACAIATMLQNADLQARVLWSRSVCAGWQGNWEQAISDIEEAMQVAQQYGGMSMAFPYLLVQAAKAYFFAEKVEEAQSYVERAIELGKSRQYRQVPAIAQRLQGRIWQEQGRFEQAELYFERSLTALKELDDVVEYARTQEAYGYFYLARKGEGDEARGEELLRSARETFKRLGVNG
jgi:tetratricopeptide (TPR) repeat protein